MKKMMMVVVIAATTVARADVVNFAASPDGSGGIAASVAVDALAFTPRARKDRSARKAETKARRANMSGTEIIADHLANNWGKYATAASVLVVDRVAANNDMLWYEWFGLSGKKSGKKAAGNDVIGDDTQTAIVLSNTINGNGNTITQNIIIQAPNGSGSGMQGNTGTGGIANDQSTNRGGE